MAKEGFHMQARIDFGAFDGLQSTFKTPQVFLPVIKKETQRAVKTNFHEFPSKHIWAEWTKETKKTKRRKGKKMKGIGGGQAILQESMKLYSGSVNHPRVRVRKKAIEYSTGNIGQPKQKAVWMQYGTGKFKNSWRSGERIPSLKEKKPGRGNIVPRPFMVLSTKQIKKINLQLVRYIDLKIKRTKRVKVYRT